MSLDPACHAECLEFIRVAIAEAFRTTAHEITAVLKEVCTEGHTNLSAIWSDFTKKLGLKPCPSRTALIFTKKLGLKPRPSRTALIFTKYE